MLNANRDILVLLKEEWMTHEAMQRHLELIHQLLKETESSSSFCRAHELVDRNCITANPKKIIKASRFYRLKPFRFLINKN